MYLLPLDVHFPELELGPGILVPVQGQLVQVLLVLALLGQASFLLTNLLDNYQENHKICTKHLPNGCQWYVKKL